MMNGPYDELIDLLKKANDLTSQLVEFECADEFDEDDFQKHMDETMPEVDIAGSTFQAGRALRELSPVTFRCQYSDWLDSMDKTACPTYRDLLEELEDLAIEASSLGFDDLYEHIYERVEAFAAP